MNTQLFRGPEAPTEGSVTRADVPEDILSGRASNSLSESFVENSVGIIENQEQILHNQQPSRLSEALVERPATDFENQEEILNQESPSWIDENGSQLSTTAESISNKSLPLRLSLQESLGYSGLFGIIGGSLFILGIFAFLTFLWFGHGSDTEAADATSLWRFIALHNYFFQTITIFSVALRFAVSIQAAICTSMIAALILEKYGTQKSQVAWFSIMRSLNDGPIKLGGLLLSARPRSAILHIESWLTFLVILVTIALQFSSTLLLADVNNFVILSDGNNTEFGDTFLYNGSDFFVTATSLQFILQHPVYAAFGEVQAGFNAYPNDNGVSDTGLVQRSLLPIREADVRASVRKIEATTMVMSSQSSCIRPAIITGKYSPDYGNPGNPAARVVGTVDYDASFDGAEVTPGSLCGDTGCGFVEFDCFVPTTHGNAGWQTMACVIDGIIGSHGLSISQVDWNVTDGPWSRNATIMLVITSNTEGQDWAGISPNTTLPAGSPYQEWQSYAMNSSYFLNITLCSFGFNIDRFRTSMAAARPLHEPQTQLALTSKTIHNTTDVQSFMGVQTTQRNHAERKILDLDILGTPEDPEEPSSARIKSRGNVTAGELTTTLMEIIVLSQLSPGFTDSLSLTLCYFCVGFGYPVNPEIGLLFSDTVAQTGRAANALLSLMTTLFTSVYYEFFSTLQVTSSAHVVATTTVQTPGPCSTHGCGGYIAVSTLVLIHVICVVAITVLYVVQVRHSRHGDVWHAIAQLNGDDLTDVLREAHDSSDSIVESTLKTQHGSQNLKVGKQGKNGRVEVIRV